MSRTQSQGIDYFPFAVDFFSDTKVKILKARYGADGIAVYVYILCQIYREGYYCRANDDFIYIMSDDLHISSDTVQQVLTFLLSRSMFNEQLFKSDAILTCDGIQERWQNAVKARAAKTPITVENYWLLPEEKTAPFIKCTLFEHSSEKKDDNSEKKDDNSENYPQSKVKYSKVKESKVNIKKESKKEKEREDKEEYTTHAQIMEDDGVTGILKSKLTEFLKTCYLNGHIVSNDKLEDIIVRLDMKYGKDEQAKCDCVARAISGGYFDIKI
ncbi:MAG: DUF4373 domain-containing protein [Clostridia bacterium]|nr:DUF4373 domain-containing protein [Clostridia bacterium]